jgi:TetR/AcrR family transcriptional regulator, cholesterol catabolism regulator
MQSKSSKRRGARGGRSVPARRPAARAPARASAEPRPGGGRNTHRRAGEILDAAARVFAQRGYHGASTQDIADTLGIRQASLYYYFPSKEAALEQVCLQGVGGFHETAQGIHTGPGTPGEKLASLIRAHIAPLLDRSDFVRVFLTQRQFLPNESRRRIGKWSRGIEQIFESVIREGMRKGEFRRDADPRLSTLAILGMANAVAAWYGKENASIERIGGEFVALALAGLTVAARSRGRRG